MKVVCVLALCALMLGVAGCGNGGGQLSKADYNAALAKFKREANAAHAAFDRDAPAATTVAGLVAALRTFADSETKLGDEVAALKPPTDAEAANAELAKGEHDDADELRAILPKLSQYATVGEVKSYLQSVGQPKGAKEQDAALLKLNELGYAISS